MIKIMIYTAAFVAASCNFATADVSPLEFLKALEGTYRGKGEAIMPVSQKAESIRCSVNNSFDETTQTLQIEGRCATVQGKSDVTGSLAVENGSITGSFLSTFDGLTIKETSNEFQNGELVVLTTIVDNTSGEMSKLRQLIRHSEDEGFETVFQKYEEASSKYVESGVLTFLKRDE